MHGGSELWPVPGHWQLAVIKTCARTGQHAKVIQAVVRVSYDCSTVIESPTLLISVAIVNCLDPVLYLGYSAMTRHGQSPMNVSAQL